MECSNINCAENTRITLSFKGQALPLCREHAVSFTDVLLQNFDAGSFPYLTISV